MIILDKNNLSCSVLTKTKNDPLLKSEMTFPGLRLCYIVQGDAVWKINGFEHNVKTGDMVAFDEMQRRCFTNHGATELKVFVMQFDRSAFADRRYFYLFRKIIKMTDCVVKNQELSCIVKDIFEEATFDSEGKYDMLSAKTTEFFIKAQRLLLLTENTLNEDERMAEILDVIDSSASTGISLSKVAQMAGFSQSAFSRRFSKLYGVSFKRYIMIKKIEKAVKLLKTTELKVVDVAYECGFNSISGFYDTFKKITGTTPDKILTII